MLAGRWWRNLWRKRANRLCWRCCSAWERHCAAQASLRRTQHCATPT